MSGEQGHASWEGRDGPDDRGATPSSFNRFLNGYGHMLGRRLILPIWPFY